MDGDEPDARSRSSGARTACGTSPRARSGSACGSPGTELPERATGAARRASQRRAPRSLAAEPARRRGRCAPCTTRRCVDHLADDLGGLGRRPGFAGDHGQDRVVPYVFPTAGCWPGCPRAVPAAAHARAGLFCYDTMTLVGPGTWAAVRGRGRRRADRGRPGRAPARRLAYALCRPPGHHATRGGYGGSCYLNNAAVAAAGAAGGRRGRVAVVDIDAHHGNGTQAIFYDRADVFYGSRARRPGRGLVPALRRASPTSAAAATGAGANRNVPLAPGHRRRRLARRASHGCATRRPRTARTRSSSRSGVDAAADDPESPLQVTADGYRRAGELARPPSAAGRRSSRRAATTCDVALAVAALEGASGSRPVAAPRQARSRRRAPPLPRRFRQQAGGACGVGARRRRTQLRIRLVEQ